MHIEVKIDAACTEPKLVIYTDRMTEEVSELLGLLSAQSPQVLAGFRDGEAMPLEQENIVRVYASGGGVYAVTTSGEYRLRLRLYEAEARLDKRTFVRISNAEIINLKKVKGFDLSLTGTICVSLHNGEQAYVSRRYLTKIKQLLGM